MTFPSTKRTLRNLETEYNTTPVRINQGIVNDDIQWDIELAKLVLYRHQSRDNSFPFQVDETLDCFLHANILKETLEHDFPSVSFSVTVTPQFKTLPIPFVTIPIKIPFTDVGWRKSPNQVRGDDTLATLPTHVKITACGSLDTIDGHSLWNSLNKISSLHTNNYCNSANKTSVIHTHLSERPSKNPLLWILNGIARLGRMILPNVILNHIPHALTQASRPYPYGYTNATRVLDTPLINSGFGALTANTVIIGAPIVAVSACVVLAAAAEIKEGTRSNSSSTGFILGSMFSSRASNTDLLVGNIMTATSAPGTLANGYGNGLLFGQTMALAGDATAAAVSAASDPSMHAPFATKAVMRAR